MERARFMKIAAEVLDTLPEHFRQRIRNVAVLVEDVPPQQRARRRPRQPREPGRPRRLVLGIYQGVPLTRKSVFDLSTGPDYVVLYQKNIEAVCCNEAEIRLQIRQTILHELGHYFGMDENQLRDV